MLVLNRKRSQRIIINDDITVVILGINDDEVRVGVEAPDDVSIHRAEIYHKIEIGEDTAGVDNPRTITHKR